MSIFPPHVIKNMQEEEKYAHALLDGICKELALVRVGSRVKIARILQGMISKINGKAPDRSAIIKPSHCRNERSLTRQVLSELREDLSHADTHCKTRYRLEMLLQGWVGRINLDIANDNRLFPKRI